MSSYPLYDMLLKEIPHNQDLTSDQKKEFLSSIPNLDSDGQTTLMILIRLYNLRNKNVSDENLFDIPFNGSNVTENSIKFDVENFPFTLKQMLYRFVNIHLQKTKNYF